MAIKVYEEGSDDDPVEQLYGTYIDWINAVQKVLGTFDDEDIKRCLMRVTADDSRAAEILRLEIETSLAFKVVGRKMEEAGATQWCLYHDCDATKCPHKTHFWCTVHDCDEDECPDDACQIKSDPPAPSPGAS
jgi:hypothetical protein